MAGTTSPLSPRQTKILRACLKACLLPVAKAPAKSERSRVLQLFGCVGLFVVNPGEFRENACTCFDCGTVTHPPEWAEEWFGITSETMDAWVGALSYVDVAAVIDAVLEHYRAAVARQGADFHDADFPFAAERE